MTWNFVFIVADDLFSYRRFLKQDRVWGHAPFGIEVPLPGLEKLEARSTVFDRAYCTVPVCGPSRAAVMSGYSPAHTGILANDSDWKQFLKPEHIWTYQIRQKGYFMGTVGKVFHGYRPQPGDVYRALYDTPPFRMEWFPRTEPKQHGGMHGKGWDGDEHRYYDHNVASTVIDFLDTYDGKSPFWYEAGFHHPHVPFYAPNRIFESINLDDIIMPEDWKLGWDLLPFTEQHWSGNALGPRPSEWSAKDTDFWRKTVRNYIANVMWMDEQLLRILDGLDASNYAKDTIVTFYSDHGYHLADKGHWHKFTLWEECAAAPMMISVPGQNAQVINEPVSMMDLGPTCLDYAGADIRPHHKGLSLRSVIEGAPAPERLVPTFWFGSVSAAIGDYRIILTQDGGAEFYNIIDDPWQVRNLAGDHPDFETYRAQMIEMAAEWGFCVVEDQVAVTPGTPFASHLGEKHDIDQTATNFIAIGDVQVRARTPGYVRMWSTHNEEGAEIRLPDHVSEFTMMSGSKAASLHITGNNKSNKIKLGRIANTKVHLDLGDGNDSNTPGQSYVVAFGRGGNDTLRAGNRGGELHGGAGDDILLGSNREDLIYAGPGNDQVEGGRGPITLYTGPGTCQVDTGGSDNVIVLDGGENTVQSGPGKNRFIVKRTGLRQIIRNFSGDVLDLSDWVGLGDVRVTQGNRFVDVTAGLEIVRLMGISEDALRDAITFEPFEAKRSEHVH